MQAGLVGRVEKEQEAGRLRRKRQSRRRAKEDATAPRGNASWAKGLERRREASEVVQHPHHPRAGCGVRSGAAPVSEG